MNQLNSPYLKDALCHVWLKLVKCFGEVSPPPQKKNHQPPNKQKQNKNKQKQNKINPYVNLFLTISITKTTGPVNETKKYTLFYKCLLYQVWVNT